MDIFIIFYDKILKEIEDDVKIVGTSRCLSYPEKRRIGIFVSENRGYLNHPDAVFPYLLGKDEILNKYIGKKFMEALCQK